MQEDPTLLDWVKSLLRGRPLHLPGSSISGASPQTASTRASGRAPGRVDGGAVRGDGEGEVARIGFLEWVSAHPLRAAGLMGGSALSLVVFYTLPRMPADARYGPIAFVWVLSMGFFLYGVPDPLGVRSRSFRLALTTGRRLPVAAGFVFLIALVVRVAALSSVPFNLGGDEASQGLEALRVIGGVIRNPFATGWLSVPTLSFFYESLGLRLFGRTILGLRLPWALVGTATVIVVFLLVTYLKGPRLGLLAAALLAVYHYHIHFSRLGSNQIADPLFTAASLLFLHRAVDTRNRLCWALSGVVCGLALYFYAGARLAALLTAVNVGYIYLRRWRLQGAEIRRGAGIAVAGFLVAGAPMIQYALRFPDTFNARLNQVGIIQSGWLVREVGIRGQSMATILWDQFVRASLAFSFFPDRTVWYGLKIPLLDPIFASLFVLGLGYATVRAFLPHAERGLFTMVAWWWSGMLLGGMMTESPPSSMRLVTLAVPVCFFIAYALWKLVLLARRALRPIPVNALLALGFLAFAFLSLRLYFVEFSPQRLYGSRQAEIGVELAPVLNELSPSHRVFFLGAPRMYLGFATIPYLVPNLQGEDIEDPLQAPPAADLLPSGMGAAFVFLPERASELSFVETTFPDGRLVELDTPTTGGLLAMVYVVGPRGTE